ncbi:MAG: hypothetical protein O7I93_17240 [Gemmatimonadetes bacterium]|nr:hypothetical protein [Gemmatimonadota bacterium]
MRKCAKTSPALALCVSMILAVVGCQPSAVYVGVGVAGPWYGPGRYPSGGMGGWGRPPGVIYEDEEVPAESYPVCETPPLYPEG